MMDKDLIAKTAGNIYWKDLQGRILGCNQEFAELAGFKSPEELIGKTDRDLVLAKLGEENVKRIEALDQEVMTKGVEKQLQEIWLDVNGKMVAYLTKKVPLRDKDNKIIGLMGTSLNITDFTSIQTNIINHSMGNLFWKDLNGIFLGCNKACAEELGFSCPEDIIGRTHFNLKMTDPVLIQQVEDTDKEVITTGREIVREEIGTTVRGELRAFISKKGPLRDSFGNIIGLIGTSIDITDQKRAERIKTEFLENMRHDIRTPLSGIIGFAQLIKDEAQDTKIAEYADNMMASSQTLMHLLNDILEVIEITSGRVPYSNKRFNLKNIINSILDLEAAKLKADHTHVDVDYDATIPVNLLGDVRRVHRILLELINNAVKFTHKGRIDIKTELIKKTTRKCLIKITITDTGIGIPEDKLQEVFSHFTRLKPSHEGIYRGLGLGLTVVKSYVNDLQGTIEVNSTLQKGSVFTVILPLKESLAADKKTEIITPSASTSVPETTRNKKLSVLVVEDQPMPATVAQELLKNIHCDVDIATTGQAAILHSKAKKYDLILMDIGLPDINGDQATKEIRHWEQHSGDYTPIIALTAHANSENKEAFIKSGMDAVFTKPLTKEVAVDILDAFVHKTKTTPIKAPVIKTNNKIIDLKLGATLVNKDEIFAREMITTLINMLPEESRIITEAYQKADWKAVCDVAHRLKGATSYCGTPRLHKAASNLQSYLLSTETQDRELLYQNFIDEVEALKRAFKNL